MRRRTALFVVLADMFVLLLGGAGLVQQLEKARVPLSLDNTEQGVTVMAPSAHGFVAGDIVRAIDGRFVPTMGVLEFCTDGYSIGDSATLTIDRGGASIARTVVLAPFYSHGYIALTAAVGLFLLALGIFVLVRRPHDPPARIFHATMDAAFLTVVASWGRYSYFPPLVTFLLTLAICLAYTTTATLLFQFTFAFPAPKWRRARLAPALLHAAAVLVGLAAALVRFTAAFLPELRMARLAEAAVGGVQWTFVAGMVLSVASFIHSYFADRDDASRRKLRWVAAGFLVGPGAIVALYFLPQLLFHTSIIGEDVMVVFVGLAAAAFATAIVRDHVLEIDRIVNRSSAYVLTLVLLGAVYVSIVAASGAIAGSMTPQWGTSAIAATIVALAFERVRVRVQRFVDRKFFRLAYDIRAVLVRFTGALAHAPSIDAVAGALVEHATDAIPVERCGAFYLEPRTNRLRLLAHEGFDLLERRGVRFERDAFPPSFDLPVGRLRFLDAAVTCVPADEEMFARWGLALALPLRNEQGGMFGFFAVGPKRAGTRFTATDVDLLAALASQASLAIARVALQESLLLESAEAARLRELNALKSQFVSGVTHDLKTPLTSIRMFAEILGGNPALDDEARRQLAIIEGESMRLARLIGSVLDFAAAERGVKEYRFAPVAINACVEQALRIVEYQAAVTHTSVHAELAGGDTTVRADGDAVTDAIVNLLGNAIKYGGDRKQLDVSTAITPDAVIVRVRDCGIGIAPDAIPHLFQPFYRVKDPSASRVGGTGLGLANVKHIMDAHNGRVSVTSVPGQGREFQLFFPTTARTAA